VETVIDFFPGIDSSKEQHLFDIEIFCDNTNVFTVTFDAEKICIYFK